MILVSSDGYPFEVSIDVFLGLVIENYFSMWLGYLVGVSLGALGGLIIGTEE